MSDEMTGIGSRFPRPEQIVLSVAQGQLPISQLQLEENEKKLLEEVIVLKAKRGSKTNHCTKCKVSDTLHFSILGTTA